LEIHVGERAIGGFFCPTLNGTQFFLLAVGEKISGLLDGAPQS
jgi:hypothetical protein